ncbi:MAG TPA: N-acetyltransferase [Cyclobacteriaceae bacterium]|nr:N-acetyltransferase [Cyclobacteriaceae bacterium]
MLHIRKTTPPDNRRVTEIWLESSIPAHDFIPEQYWKQNEKIMEEHYLPLSEVYVAEENGHILGFIALIDQQVAALFVHPDHQGKGIGKLLLQHTQSLREVLELKVYQKNTKSLGFYLNKGFEIVAESLDPHTGEKEWVMQWTNKSL